MTDTFGSVAGFTGMAVGSLIFGQGWILVGAVTMAVMGALAIRIKWRRGKEIGDS